MATRASKKGRAWWERLDLTGRHFVDPKFRTPAYEKAVAALVACGRGPYAHDCGLR